MDTIILIRTFVRVVEKGSFSAVANEEMTNQATISKRIANLENKLATKLLVRGSRKHQLTEAGDIYYRHACNILLSIEEAESEVSLMTQRPKGLLRISASTIFASKFISPVLPEFLRQYPLIHLDLKLSEKKIDLTKEGIDIAIRLGELTDSSMIARRLGQHELIIVASKEYINQNGNPNQLMDLSHHNCLIYNLLPKQGAVWQLDKDGIQEEIEVKGNFQCNNGIGLKEMLLSGAGIALIPRWMIEEELAEGSIVHILTEYKKNYPINAVYPNNRYIPLKVRYFLDYFKRSLEKYNS